MSESDKDENVTEETGGLEDGMRSSRELRKNVDEKSRLLKEQLLKLEKKLWGRKPDETVATQ
ncbi:hypothetical protein ABS71_17520 [bacterium SCN 62-11]|nr:hypothetical protein [Candidatus Eremiobacteraeota bacterium]ODT60056.1 MAG: hypothetical protein ABS71_17520 [bacterium SCN 62-11]